MFAYLYGEDRPSFPCMWQWRMMDQSEWLGWGYRLKNGSKQKNSISAEVLRTWTKPWSVYLKFVDFILLFAFGRGWVGWWLKWKGRILPSMLESNEKAMKHFFCNCMKCLWVSTCMVRLAKHLWFNCTHSAGFNGLASVLNHGVRWFVRQATGTCWVIRKDGLLPPLPPTSTSVFILY